jgi:hypothetical protein
MGFSSLLAALLRRSLHRNQGGDWRGIGDAILESS